MSNLLQGVIAGVVFGGLAVATMLPMAFPDKPAALLAAFIDRFAVGVVIGAIHVPWPGWLLGLAVGLLLSLPSAIITKAYLPIILVGCVGGTVIGGVIHGWGLRA